MEGNHTQASQIQRCHTLIKVILAILGGSIGAWGLLNLLFAVDTVNLATGIEDGKFRLLFDKEVWFWKGWRTRVAGLQWILRGSAEVAGLYLLALTLICRGVSSLTAGISGLALLCTEKIRSGLQRMKIAAIVVLIPEAIQIVLIIANVDGIKFSFC